MTAPAAPGAATAMAGAQRPPVRVDPARRRARLLDLLPRIYAAQAADSAVAKLIDVMALALAEFDDTLRRVLNDRWVALASGAAGQPPDDDHAALDRLGALLRIDRLPSRIRHAGVAQDDGRTLAVAFLSDGDRDDALRSVAAASPMPLFPVACARLPGLQVRVDPDDTLRLVFDRMPGLAGDAPSPLAALRPLLQPEPSADYRQRLLLTSGLSARGLGTPRSLLQLAIADLGAAACARFDRQRNATLARGVATGARQRCPACADPAARCPQATLFEAWITEQPARQARWSASQAALRQVLPLVNDSLVADRPELTLACNQAVSFPAVQSRSSGEIMLFAGDLEPGWNLNVLPRLTADEDAAVACHDRPVGHNWLLRSPQGRAELVEPATGRLRDVSDAMFYLWGNKFDDPAARLGGVGFDGLRCGVLEQAVRSPQLVPGDNDWVLLSFDAPVYRFDAATARLGASADDDHSAHFALFDQAIATTDARFAKVLFELLERAHRPIEGGGGQAGPSLSVEARWVERPPFQFRLRVPKNGWVQAAELRGAADLLRDDIERSRPAGVRPQIDFPEPVYTERMALAEQSASATSARSTEDAGGLDALAGVALHGAMAEDHGPAEGALTVGAIWSVTRFGWSVLH